MVEDAQEVVQRVMAEYDEWVKNAEEHLARLRREREEA